MGNTFAHWTRAAIGFYDLSDLAQIEVGENAWKWVESPNSWKGEGELPGYRIYTSGDGSGFPVIRDFNITGAYDHHDGRSRRQSRDVKTPKGGVTGAHRPRLQVATATTVFTVSDICDEASFGGIISMTATNSSDHSLIATYLLFVSSGGSVCRVVESGGYIDGDETQHPSFSWALSGGDLQATPIGSAGGTYDFDAVSLGAVSLK